MGAADILITALEGLPPAFVIIVISALPVVELRGAIPVGILVYGMPWWEAAAFSILGNILPVPAILLLLGPVEQFLRRWTWWDDLFARLIDRTIRRTSEKIKRFESFGLTLFVGTPLPVTGAWTGSLAAHVFQLGFWRAFASICLGVVVAAVIVTTVVLSGEAAWIGLR